MASSFRNKQVSRRRFLGYGVAAISSVIIGLVGVPVVGSILSPIFAKKRAESEWIELGTVQEFKPLKPTMIEYSVLTKNAWVSEAVKRGMWVVTKDGSDFTVWNPRCTHLGCAYFYDAQEKLFKCPCHAGIFEPYTGEVLGGPPPRPLDSLPMKIENGKIYAIYKDFKAGISDKVEL